MKHSLPDGSAHLDWMIEPAEPGRGLITFRMEIGADLSKPGAILAERIGDHRREYLTYEGPISNGRGRVERVASFSAIEVLESETTLRIVLEMSGDGGRMEWRGERAAGPGWKFVGVVC